MGGLSKVIGLIADLARDIVRAEAVTAAGRLNALGTIVALAIVLAAGAADIAQVVIRSWDRDYSTGLPSSLAMFAIWGGIFLVCVLIIALVPPKRIGRDGQG